MRAGAIIALALGCVSCYGVMEEDLEVPDDGTEAQVANEIFVVPSLPTLDSDIDPTRAGAVGTLLVRLQIEPTAWGTGHTFTRSEAGRGPWVSLYADGTLIWNTDAGMRIASVPKDEARTLHRKLLDHGVGEIPSYEKDRRPSEGAMCVSRKGPAPCKPGGTLFMADVEIEIWEVDVAGRGLQASRHYAGWAPGRDADLRAARSLLSAATEAAAGDSKPFLPDAATLMLQKTDWYPDAEPWPLAPELFASTLQSKESVALLEGTDLDTMSRYIAGYGKAHFVRDGELVEATLVPWLPDQDWTPEIEAFEPPN